jgi:hypothetical protein
MSGSAKVNVKPEPASDAAWQGGGGAGAGAGAGGGAGAGAGTGPGSNGLRWCAQEPPEQEASCSQTIKGLRVRCTKGEGPRTHGQGEGKGAPPAASSRRRGREPHPPLAGAPRPAAVITWFEQFPDLSWQVVFAAEGGGDEDGPHDAQLINSTHLLIGALRRYHGRTNKCFALVRARPCACVPRGAAWRSVAPRIKPHRRRSDLPSSSSTRRSGRG